MPPDLQATERRRNALWLRFALVVAALALSARQLDFTHDLRRLDAGLLSGTPEGNYHAIAEALVRDAAAQRGRLREVLSQGSADNVARLHAARRTCEVAFGLVQDGSSWGEPGGLELVGRLRKSDSVFFLGTAADELTELTQLAGKRIGIGPAGSGSAALMQHLFAMPELAPLGVRLEHGSLAQELAQVEAGQLDLMVVVLDEDTPWLVEVVRGRKLQIAGLSRLDVISRKLPHFRTGRIGAGQFDPLLVLPPVDKRVLRVDTLVVGNGCAGRSATLDLLSLLARKFPDFLRHNQDTANTTELALAPAARDFFENSGRHAADEYVPWLVDVMPPANWAYLVMGVSILFNAMGLGHRFRLWRIDVARVRLEAEIAALFGPTTTLGDIARGDPHDFGTATAPAVHAVIKQLEVLAERCRRQSLSMLVPMGQEMTYRYQERLITDALGALRGFIDRAQSSSGGSRRS